MTVSVSSDCTLTVSGQRLSVRGVDVCFDRTSTVGDRTVIVVDELKHLSPELLAALEAYADEVVERGSRRNVELTNRTTPETELGARLQAMRDVIVVGSERARRSGEALAACMRDVYDVPCKGPSHQERRVAKREPWRRYRR